MTHYLDHAASTPARPVAVEAMLPLLTDDYGNPSGAHRLARSANRVLDDARETMAECLGARPGEIVFTGGGTESDNLAVLGSVEAHPGVALCSAVEHPAVLDAVAHVGGSAVRVDSTGVIDLDHLATLLTPEVSLVSVMLANNETGIIQPLAEVAELVRARAPRAILHTDAVQALCWLDVAERCRPADLVSVSAHKFGGVKGVGALVVRDGVTIARRAFGGGQERERRSGTQNVAGVAAMAAAAAATVADRVAQVERVGRLRDRLTDGILTAVSGVIETGERENKTANMCHLCFEGIESEALLFLLEKDDIMASAASSCASGAMEPSHVLAAMGYDRHLAFGSLRLSLGHDSTDADVDAALAAVPPAVARLRASGS